MGSRLDADSRTVGTMLNELGEESSDEAIQRFLNQNYEIINGAVLTRYKNQGGEVEARIVQLLEDWTQKEIDALDTPLSELSHLVGTPAERVVGSNLAQSVDEFGIPTRLLHGSPNKFDGDFRSSEGGIFFTDRDDLANYYASVNKKKPGQVVPVNLSVKNPKTVDFNGGTQGRIKAINEAREGGHDVLIMKNYLDPEIGVVQTQYVVVDPTIIRRLDVADNALEKTKLEKVIELVDKY